LTPATKNDEQEARQQIEIRTIASRLPWWIRIAIDLCVLGIIWAAWYLSGKYNPDAKEFQTLLALHGGWHDIEWISSTEVHVKHEIGNIPFEFRIRRTYRGISEIVVAIKPSINEYAWTRFSSERKFLEDYPPEIKRQIEYRANQVWDAFCQGETP
jgi:hypothetical protein